MTTEKQTATDANEAQTASPFGDGCGHSPAAVPPSTSDGVPAGEDISAHEAMDKNCATNAPLIDAHLEVCVRLHRPRVEDELGGFRAGDWSPGAAFPAVLVKNADAGTHSAGQESASSRYTVTTPPGTGLRFHDVFMRCRDGATFRVTHGSEDSGPPDCATFAFEQAGAQRWLLD